MENVKTINLEFLKSLDGDSYSDEEDEEETDEDLQEEEEGFFTKEFSMMSNKSNQTLDIKAKLKTIEMTSDEEKGLIFPCDPQEEYTTINKINRMNGFEEAKEEEKINSNLNNQNHMNHMEAFIQDAQLNHKVGRQDVV